jgi:hypothetical protein
MHSTVSQQYTSMLRACWTLARIPRLLATYEFGTATSAHGSCKPCTVRFRRIAAHFFPHTCPPDTHTQFSPQRTTFTHTLAVGAACLECQGSLVNTYSSLVLRSMGGSSSALATHAPQWITLKMVSTDLATTRLTRTTLAFRTTVLAIRVSPLHAEVPAALPLHAEVSAALAAADIATHAPQARPLRLMAHQGKTAIFFIPQKV